MFCYILQRQRINLMSASKNYTIAVINILCICINKLKVYIEDYIARRHISGWNKVSYFNDSVVCCLGQHQHRTLSILTTCKMISGHSIDKLVQSRSDRDIMWRAVMVFAPYNTHHHQFDLLVIADSRLVNNIFNVSSFFIICKIHC